MGVFAHRAQKHSNTQSVSRTARTPMEKSKMHPIREQFIRDMQTSGLSEATQQRYLKNVDLFFKAVWCSPEAVTEAMVQDFIIEVRERDVARETFRGYHYALKCFFVATMRRDWDLLKKTPFVLPPDSVCARP